MARLELEVDPKAAEDGTVRVKNGLDGVKKSAAGAEAALKTVGSSAKTLKADAAQLKAQIASTDAELKKLQASGKGADASVKALRGSLAGLRSELAQNRAAAAAAAVEAARLGNANEVAAGQTGNIAAQLNDVFVTLQAGQSPFQVAIQQGSQLNQVFGQLGSGKAIFSALAGAVTSLLNPISLATFAVIAFGGAAVQWFFSAGDAADNLSGKLTRQQEIIEALKEKTADLILQRQILESGAKSSEEQEGLNELARLTAERAALQERLNSLLEVGSRAAGFAEQAQAKRDILQAEIATVDALIESTRREQERLEAAEKSAQGADRMRALMAQIAATNINGPWAAVLGAIDSAITKANQYRSAMSSSAYSAELANTGQSSGPDAARTKVQFGGGAFRAPVLGAGLAFEAPRGGGGGGGGAAGQAAQVDQLKTAYDSLIGSLDETARAQAALDAGQKTINEALAAGVINADQAKEAMGRLQQRYLEATDTMAAAAARVEESLKRALDPGEQYKQAAQGIFGAFEQFLLNPLDKGFKGLLLGVVSVFQKIAAQALSAQLTKFFLPGLQKLFFDSGGYIPRGGYGIVAERRPELVDGRLVSQPSLVKGPAKVTGGAATGRMLGGSGGGAAPAVNLTTVVVESEEAARRYITRPQNKQQITRVVQPARMWRGA